MIRRAAGAALLALAAACAPGADPGAAEPLLVRDSAGVRIAETPSGAPLPHIPVDPAPVLTLGRERGRDHQFRQARDVQRLGDGQIVVANAYEREVLFYDRRGTFLRRVGGHGDAPNPFRSLTRLRRMEGDTLAITDASSRRITLVDAAGRVARVIPFRTPFADPPEGEICTPGVTLGLLPGDVQVAADFACVETGPAGPRMLRTTYHLVGDSLEVRIGAFDLLPVHWFDEPGLRPGYGFPPFSASAPQEVTPEGFLYSPGSRRELQVRDVSGRLTRIVRDLEPAEPVTEADREALRLRRERTGQPLGGRAPFADSLAVWLEVLADDRGNHWALENSWPEAAQVWRVYGPQGARLGAVNLPEGFRLSSVRGGELLGVRTDALGVERVEVYRLRGGG